MRQCLGSDFLYCYLGTLPIRHLRDLIVWTLPSSCFVFMNETAGYTQPYPSSQSRLSLGRSRGSCRGRALSLVLPRGPWVQSCQVKRT